MNYFMSAHTILTQIQISSAVWNEDGLEIKGSNQETKKKAVK